MLFAIGLALAWASLTPDTVDVAVGSPLINWRLEQPYRSKFEIWRVDGKDSTRLVSGLNVVTHRHGELLVRAEAPPAPNETMMFDLHTLAYNHDTSAFYAPAADILVEFLPRRLDVVYRVRLRGGGSPAIETHLYQTRRREHGVWVVDDYNAATGKLASRLWLVDKPPYMLRWTFFDAPTAGSVIHARQMLAQ
jgi:hypothetical protein